MVACASSRAYRDTSPHVIFDMSRGEMTHEEAKWAAHWTTLWSFFRSNSSGPMRGQIKACGICDRFFTLPFFTVRTKKTTLGRKSRAKSRAKKSAYDAKTTDSGAERQFTKTKKRVRFYDPSTTESKVEERRLRWKNADSKEESKVL